MDKRKHDDLENDIEEIKIQLAIRDAKESVWRLVCITATSSILGFSYWLGAVIYSNSKAVMAGVKAFWLTSGHGE